MKKKRTFDDGCFKPKRSFLMMRLTLFFVCLQFGTCLALEGHAQQVTFTLRMENCTLAEVIREIERKSEYVFFYADREIDLSRKVALDIREQPIEKVLEQLFQKSGNTWEIAGRQVILRKSAEAKSAQNQSVVTGVVTDEKGERLPGVTVVIKGTTTGVVTSMDGAYSINVPDLQQTLVFTFVGMQPREVSLGGRSELNVTLREEVTEMGEVMVTGYQNIKRESATGAFQTVRAAKLDERFAENLVERLEGTIPGLYSYATGMNESADNIMIRGVSTFSANLSPLVVVDGLPIEGNLSSINPYDVESISVLKDAAAASIYGARASNGVIVVTMKRAKSDKLEVNMSADLTRYDKPDYSYYNYMSAKEQVVWESDHFRNVLAQGRGDELYHYMVEAPTNYRTGVMELYYGLHTGEISEQQLSEGLARLEKNDFRKEYRKHALLNEFRQNYNLSIRGRSEKTTSDLIVNYKTSNQGIIKAYNRNLDINYRGSYKPVKWFDLAYGISINYGWKKSHNNKYATDAFNVPAYTTMFNEDGSRNYYSTTSSSIYEASLMEGLYGLKNLGFNHLTELERDFHKEDKINLRNFIHANVTILPEILTASSQFQYENYSGKMSNYSEADSYMARYLYNVGISKEGEAFLPDGGMLKTSNSTGRYLTFRAQVNYNQILREKHEVDAIAGFETRQTKYRLDKNMLFGYDDKTLTHMNAYADLRGYSTTNAGILENTTFMKQLYSSQIGANIGAEDVMHRYVSFYATGGYTYDRRYALSGSVRVDKTDLFGSDPKFRGRPLWSVGASWNMHNERFLQETEWVNMLKVRLSYGLTGNIDNSMSTYLTASIKVNSMTEEQYAQVDTPANDQLRWEKTASTNFGVDYAFLGNRMNGSLDLYHKYSTDLLANMELDPSEGFTSVVINNGEAVNKGVELLMNARIIRPNVRHGFGFNLAYTVAYNKNEIKSVNYHPTSGQTVVSNQTFIKGNPVRSIYSFRYKGLDDEGKMVWLYGDRESTAKPATEATRNDVAFSGGLDPKLTMSISPEVTFERLTLSASIVYYGGHYMRANREKWDVPYLKTSGYGYAGDRSRDMLKGWTPTNGETYYIGNGLNAPSNYTRTDAFYGDFLIQDADFLKVRNITMTYMMPEEICSKMRMSSMRLRLQATNPFKWTRNDIGIDPEANNAWSGVRRSPQLTSYTFSVSVNF